MTGNIFTPGGYTDLACERVRATGAGVSFERKRASVGVWERIHTKEDMTDNGGLRAGHYHSLHTNKIENMDSFECEDTAEEIGSELWRLCELNTIMPKRVLAVGLGNERLAPDALGPLTAKAIEATMHLKGDAPELFSALGCTEIAVIRPGVYSESGIETADAVGAMCDRLKPELVILIDALCATSEERLGTTVQLSDVGIFPGSGVGNPRAEISGKALGCGVITIGIPTVIDSGILSSRNRGERMLVTPRYINPIIDMGARIIAGAINRAFGVIR